MNVQADVLLRGLKQRSHVLLREPDCFTLEPHVDLQLSILGLVNEELAFGGCRAVVFVGHRSDGLEFRDATRAHLLDGVGF